MLSPSAGSRNVVSVVEGLDEDALGDRDRVGIVQDHHSIVAAHLEPGALEIGGRRRGDGVKGDGLSTTVLPARSAGATFADAMVLGKFHGDHHGTTSENTRLTPCP